MSSAFQISIGLLLCSIGLSVPAATIHRWVDEHGVTHFSDAPPAAGNVSELQTLELSDDFPAAPDTRTNYYSIANQWERMREERQQKTQVELQKARIRAEKAAAVAYSEPAAETESRHYYPLYLPNSANRGRGHRQPFYDDFGSARRTPQYRGRSGHIAGGARGRSKHEPRGGIGGRSRGSQGRMRLR